MRRQRATRRLDHHELGVQLGRHDRVDDQLAAADVVDRDNARQDRHPVGARDEFEGCDHGVHLEQGRDLDAVALEICFQISAADIVRSRHHEFQRRTFGQAQWRQRSKSALRAGDQHFSISYKQPRFQSDGAFERRHYREVEFFVEHHFGEQAAIALDDVQAHLGAARHEIVEYRRQHRAGESRHQPDAQFAGDLAGKRARFLGRVFQGANRLHAALVVTHAGRRRCHASGAALEQLDPELTLDRRHMLRNARLGGVFTLGGARKRAFLADRDDGADLAEGDVAHHLSSIMKTLMAKPRLYYFFHPRHPRIIRAN